MLRKAVLYRSNLSSYNFVFFQGANVLRIVVDSQVISTFFHYLTFLLSLKNDEGGVKSF